MFFDDWNGILRIFISCVVVYSALIIWLRVSGKRTLSKWNAFDFIATIALGSILATAILSKDIPVLEGIFALVLLVALQYLITFLSVRVDWFENLVKAKPTLLYDEDEFLFNEMNKQRVAKSEILAAVRASSISSLEQVKAVVLETDGSFSVIKKSESDSNSALEDVEGMKEN